MRVVNRDTGGVGKIKTAISITDVRTLCDRENRVRARSRTRTVGKRQRYTITSSRSEYQNGSGCPSTTAVTLLGKNGVYSREIFFRFFLTGSHRRRRHAVTDVLYGQPTRLPPINRWRYESFNFAATFVWTKRSGPVVFDFCRTGHLRDLACGIRRCRLTADGP